MNFIFLYGFNLIFARNSERPPSIVTCVGCSTFSNKIPILRIISILWIKLHLFLHQPSYPTKIFRSTAKFAAISVEHYPIIFCLLQTIVFYLFNPEMILMKLALFWLNSNFVPCVFCDSNI